jgi:hypothetical protein
MNPYYRAAVMLSRTVAAGFIVVTVLDLVAYWLHCRNSHTSLAAGHCLLLSIPLVIGIVLLVKSSALARWIADYLDD